MLSSSLRRAVRAVTSWGPEERDSVLYSASALFAISTAQMSSITLYQQWGRLAVGPYTAGAILSAWQARRARRRREKGLSSSPRIEGGAWHWTTPRVGSFFLVLLGATLLPLSLEVLWRTDPGGAAHVQPEVIVVEHSGERVSKGQDPYQLVDGRQHRILVTPPKGQPAYDAYNPYLPLMSVFGLARDTKAPRRLTDARVAFSLITIFVVVGALALCRGPTGPRVLALQAMTVLPTAALPLATGGDDLPVAALMLLGLVLVQRRRPFGGGLALGVAASMKIMAWPLAAIALLAARDGRGRRKEGLLWMSAGLAAVMLPSILPTMVANLSAFVDNVVRFPLGLAGISSPAGSPLIGHLVVSLFPGMRHVVEVTVAFVGAGILVFVLWRRTPREASAVTSVVGWVMTASILLAPSTRIGYFLYPIDLFVWAWLLGHEESADAARAVERDHLTNMDYRLTWMDAAVDGRTCPGALQARDAFREGAEHTEEPAGREHSEGGRQLESVGAGSSGSGSDREDP